MTKPYIPRAERLAKKARRQEIKQNILTVVIATIMVPLIWAIVVAFTA